MAVLANHRFVKMNGLGNEIVVVDMRPNTDHITASEARLAAAGVRYDQLMAIYPPHAARADAFVRIFNNDGSEAGACGNGMRCVADILFKEGHKSALAVETPAGLLTCWKGERPLTSTIDMGLPRLRWDEIPLTEAVGDTRRIELQIGTADPPIPHSASVANMGNPHAVFWVDDVDAYDLGNIGPMLENHPIFPERANISLVAILSRTALRVRTWERGAGLTKACGSAACAAVVAAARSGRTDRAARASLPGGDLDISWRERDDHVLMTGPAVLEWRGRFDPAAFAKAGAA